MQAQTCGAWTARCMLLVAAGLLGACDGAPPAPPRIAPPIVQGTLLRFSPGDPKLQQLGLAAAVPARPDRHTSADGVVIPAAAVMVRGGKHFVMVQAQLNTFEPRDVELGFRSAREALVTAGLRAGEQVVSENALLLARQYSLAQESGSAKMAAP